MAISEKRLSLRRAGLTGILLASGLALAGCGGSPASSNPNFFSARITDGKLTGQYNPQGFTAAEVREQLKALCNDGELATYGEGPADGLVAFSATCRGGIAAAGGTIEIERAGEQVVVEQMTYDANGDMTISSNQ